MPRKKKKAVDVKEIEEVEPVETVPVEETYSVELAASDSTLTAEITAPKVWPVAPEFPPETHYYVPEKIEKFRKAYKTFKQQYEEAIQT